MFARVTIAEANPENIDQMARDFRENIGAAAKKMAGFKGSYLLVDRKSGKTIGVALWESEESLKASAEVAVQLRAGVTQAAGVTKPPVVEIYEVAAQL